MYSTRFILLQEDTIKNVNKRFSVLGNKCDHVKRMLMSLCVSLDTKIMRYSAKVIHVHVLA